MGIFMFDRIRSALAARRAAMLEAEAFVLRYGADAEAIAIALAANRLAREEQRLHYARVAVIVRRRYALLSGLAPPRAIPKRRAGAVGRAR